MLFADPQNQTLTPDDQRYVLEGIESFLMQL
jgi:hypothetical protein